MGRIFPIVSFTKQNINTKISTETEIVVVDNFMSSICWTQYLIAAQGYNVRDNHLHQDNKSSIILDNNKKVLSVKRTKHVNIRYFFITDRVNNGEVSVAWCLAGDIIDDYMTKTLQGYVQEVRRPNHGG